MYIYIYIYINDTLYIVTLYIIYFLVAVELKNYLVKYNSLTNTQN